MAGTNFGWSLPPGCGNLPGEEPDQPCEVCGGWPDPQSPEQVVCICPECPECGDYGNPGCYQNHGLRRSFAQSAQLEAMQKVWSLNGEVQAVAEAYWANEEGQHLKMNEGFKDATPPEVNAAVAEAERCLHVFTRAFSAGIKPTQTAGRLVELANLIQTETEKWQPPPTNPLTP